MHPFEPPAVPPASRCHLAEVVSVADPDARGRVQVRLLSFDGPDEQDAAIWARMVVAFAGDNRGAFFLPDVGDEVLVQFINGDPRHPVVVGSLWSGGTQVPETLPNDAVDRWSMTGKAGTRIAMVEAEAGQARIELQTPGGVTATLSDEGGGQIELQCTGGTIKIEPSGITLETGGSVTINGSQVSVSAGVVSVDAGMATFSGVVQCQTLVATTVVGTTYTPGAGNIW